MNFLLLKQQPLRRGVASIEFAMFVPVLVGFAAITLYVARIHHAKQLSSINANVDAIEEAVLAKERGNSPQLPSFAGTDSQELKQLLDAFDANLVPRAGLAIGQGVQDSGEGIESLEIAAPGPAKDSIGFLCDSWEKDILTFPVTSPEQPECTLPPSIRGIAPQLSNPAVFTALLNFGVSGGQADTNSSKQATELLSQFLNAQDDAIKASIGASQRLVQVISNLEEELADLREQPEPNFDRIRELGAAIAAGKKELEDQATARGRLISNKLAKEIFGEH
jgi:hypothetical protein